MPASACFRNPMICSWLNLLVFMSVILHKMADFSSSGWYGWRGAGHSGSTELRQLVGRLRDEGSTVRQFCHGFRNGSDDGAIVLDRRRYGFRYGGAASFLERAKGVEPSSRAWEARAMPLYDARSRSRTILR